MPPANLATARTWRTSSARLHGSPWMQMSLDTRVENLYQRVGACSPRKSSNRSSSMTRRARRCGELESQAWWKELILGASHGVLRVGGELGVRSRWRCGPYNFFRQRTQIFDQLIQVSTPETRQDGATGAGRDVRVTPVASNSRALHVGRRRQFKTRIRRCESRGAGAEASPPGVEDAQPITG